MRSIVGDLVMDALISGQAGVAILMRPEGLAAFRSDSPETEIPTTAERLRYFLWGATDVARLESTTKESALAHLRMAEDCDTALHLALILLDREADPETRNVAAESLGELFGQDEVREFVENRLHCAPLPRDADPMGALSRASSGGALEGFLVRLGQRQACIKGIRAGWDALPQSVFPPETPRQVFLKRLADSGAFRMLAEAGDDPLKFYSAKFVCYWELEGLANLRQAVRAWLEPFQPQRRQPGAQRLAGLRQADYERPSLGWESSDSRKRQRAKGRHIKGEKKDISLAHVERVGKLLDRMRKERGSTEPLLWRIDKEIEHLAEFHAQEAEDLPYYAQTLTQLAVKFSERSLFDHALQCIARAREAAPQDPYPTSLAISVYSRQGNLAGAEGAFVQAEAAGLADEVAYTALVDAYGKAGYLAKAEEVLGRAEAAGLADEVTYNALLDAYGKAGNLAKAEEVFGRAEAAGLVDEVTYSALLDAYGKAGNLAKAEEVFAQAQAAGAANIITYGALLDAYARSRESSRLLSTFDEATSQGLRLLPFDKAVLATTLLKGLYAVGREDEFLGVIPTDFLSQELLLLYARLHHRPATALRGLQSFGDISSPAQLVCRYRLASPDHEGEGGRVQTIKTEILTAVEGPAEFSLFCRVVLTDALARCHRLEGDFREMYRVWDHVSAGTLDSASRVAYYAGHGRDSVTWGLHNDKTAQEDLGLVLQGSNELLTALSLARASGMMSPGCAATYGDVVAGMAEVRRGLDFLPRSERSSILASLRSRTSISLWQQPLQSVTEIPPDIIGDAVSGQRAVIEMLQMF